MAVSNIKAIFENDIHKVWDIVFAVDKYSSWRSDLSKTEIINEKQFIEYTKDGYATTFSITAVEPYRRWEFDMENSNMAGHWIGVFMAKGNKTQVDFTENVIPKKWFMKPFVKSYLRKHQKQFVLDLKKSIRIKFQFIKNSACPAVSFTAGQALSSYTVCFPGARVNLRPSGRVTSAVRLAGISNS